MRLIVEREEERAAFHRAPSGTSRRPAHIRRGLRGHLERSANGALASGKDFDSATGRLKDATARQLDEAAANAADVLAARLPWTVTRRAAARHPAAVSAVHDLDASAGGEPQARVPADRTMSAAQRLFQEGIISYHRTDSTTLSDRALSEAAGAIQSLYGAAFYAGPRRTARRSRTPRRPTRRSGRRTSARRHHASRRIGSDERRIYELIWKRRSPRRWRMLACCGRRSRSQPMARTGRRVRRVGKAIQFSGFLARLRRGLRRSRRRAGRPGDDASALRVGDRSRRMGRSRSTRSSRRATRRRRRRATPPRS